jgi:hypothetical protein
LPSFAMTVRESGLSGGVVSPVVALTTAGAGGGGVACEVATFFVLDAGGVGDGALAGGGAGGGEAELFTLTVTLLVAVVPEK